MEEDTATSACIGLPCLAASLARQGMEIVYTSKPSMLQPLSIQLCRCHGCNQSELRLPKGGTGELFRRMEMYNGELVVLHRPWLWVELAMQRDQCAFHRGVLLVPRSTNIKTTAWQELH